MPADATDRHTPVPVTSDISRLATTNRRAVILAGYGLPDPVTCAQVISAAWNDPDPGLRELAVSASARAGSLEIPDLVSALKDPSARVRRRACELASALLREAQTSATAAETVTAIERRTTTSTAGLLTSARDNHVLIEALVEALADHDALVSEAAAWALGEAHAEAPSGAVEALCRQARSHPDPLCRESAVAALGAIGDQAGLDTVLSALEDKPAIRRRAAVALAAFDGAEVESALARCLADRDWQVRQAAEDLLHVGPNRAGDDPGNP